MRVWQGCKIFVKSLPMDKYKQGDCHLRDDSHLKLNQVTPHRERAELLPVWFALAQGCQHNYLFGIVPVNSKKLTAPISN